jgi:hypothetical protein
LDQSWPSYDSIKCVLAALKEELDCSIGGGYGKAGATLHPHPIMVRQNRACGKEIFIGWSSIGSKWPKEIIHLQTGSIHRMTSRIEEILTMPLLPTPWLINW